MSRRSDDPLITTNQPQEGISIKKVTAIAVASLSLIAAAALPYLVMKSIYFLSTKNESASFHEIMHSDNKTFWALGPLIAAISFLAIAPFNFYNIYKTVHDASNPFQSCKLLLINFMRLLFVTSGCVSAYFSNMAYVDVFNNNTTTKKVFQTLFVANALIFAGLSDSRIVLKYASEETTRDIRCLTRGVGILIRKTPRFQNRYQPQETTRKQLISRINYKLDNIFYIVMLDFSQHQVRQHQNLVQSRQWLRDINSTEMQSFCEIANTKFPLKRYLASEGLGSILVTVLAYYGNQNVLEFAKLAILNFFAFCNMDNTSNGANVSAIIFSYVGYIVSMMLSFFLVRDLFIRDICKNNQFQNFYRTIFIKFSTLIPALCFGMVNVILTIMNHALSPTDRILVAFSAIIGAVVVSRYGIEGGLKEFAGKRNFRRELAETSNILTTMLDDFSTTELESLSEKLNAANSPQVPLLRLQLS